MTTIEKIKSEINVSEIRNNDEYDIYTDWSDSEIIDCSLHSAIVTKFKKSSERISKSYMNNSRTSIETSDSFVINNDEVLNTLRVLYQTTKSSFIKGVVKTVGQSKRFTEKQIIVITEEIVKTNLTLSF